MAYATIEDFGAGTDRRSPRAAGTPGTLWSLVNGHITRGKRVEKRKKYVAKHQLPAGKTWAMKGSNRAPHVFGYEDSATFATPIPAGVVYERLVHPANPAIAMVDVLDVLTSNGKNYVIAKFADGSIHHYYDAKRVTAWDDGVLTSWRTSLSDMAIHLADLVSGDKNFSATAIGNAVLIRGRDNAVTADVTALAENGGVTSDNTVTVTKIQTPVADTPEVLATGSFVLSAGAEGKSVTSVTVGGVEILGAPVVWAESDAYTAALVAVQINAFASVPEYTAAVDTGAKVKITAVAGSGTGPNGLAVAVSGTVTSGTIVNMAGGVAKVAGRPQISLVVLGGGAEIGDRYAISLDDVEYGAGDNPSGKATHCIALGTKIYAIFGSVVFFCSINNPMSWRANVLGAGYFRVVSSGKGSEDIVAVAEYQSGLAFFCTSFVQTWAIDEDPAKNTFRYTIGNSGAKAAHAVIAAGNIDTFYLSASGVRSLRQQNITGTTFSVDAGDAMDEVIQPHILSLTDAQVAGIKTAINPLDSRIWFWVGTRVYVLSYYPESKVSAWSWYEIGMEPGWLDPLNERLYVRSGDTIYVYAGDDGKTYDADESDIYYVDAVLPYMHAGRIADDKIATGYNVGAKGEWDVFVASDPNNEAVEDVWGRIDGYTYPDPELAASITTTHFAPRFRSTKPGPAMIVNFAFDFEKVPR